MEKYFPKKSFSLQPLERVKTPIRFDSIRFDRRPSLSLFLSLSRNSLAAKEDARALERTRNIAKPVSGSCLRNGFTRQTTRSLSPVRLDRFESCSRTLKHTSAVDSGVIKSRASGPSLGSNFAAAECPTRWIVAPEVPALFPALEL